MHKILLTLCLLLPIACFGQDYQPFLGGMLHHYSAGNNYSLRIDSAGVVGNDSAFWMTPMALPPSQSCYLNNYTHYVPNQEGYFCDHFLRGNDGSYRFVSRAGDTATFHTQLPIGSAWTFLSDSNLTAAISQRTTLQIGSQLDSLLVIDISDGSSYQLSQHHGLVEGKNLSHYLNGRPANVFSMIEPPSVPDFKAFFEWQVGDVFSTVVHSNSGAGYNNYERWVVFSRTESLAGDSLTFGFRHYFAQIWYPIPDTIVVPADTVVSTVTRTSHGFLENATYELYEHGNYYHLPQPWSYNLSFLNRKTVPGITFWSGGLLDSCGYTFYGLLASPCLYPYQERYTQGIGATFFQYSIGSTMTSCLVADRSLVCYEQAGHDTLGPCPGDFIVLHQDKPQPSATLQLMRHSQSGEWSLTWEGVTDGPTLWQLYDLQGRLLQTEQVLMDRAGRRALTLPGSAGMYLLRITAESGAWTQTVKLPLN